MKSNFSLLIGILLYFTFNNIVAQNPSHPIVDSHCHIKTSPADEMFVTMEEYFAENISFNIKYVFGLTMAKKGKIEEMKTQNDSLFSMARRNSKFIPVCSVHPADGEVAIEELRRIKNLGGKIIKLHPITQQFSILSNEVYDVSRVAGELGLIDRKSTRLNSSH